MADYRFTGIADNPYLKLSIGCKEGGYDLVKEALETGINPNQGGGRHPLLTLCSGVHDLEKRARIAQMLSKWGARLGIFDANGNSPLHLACYSDNLDFVKTLVDHHPLRISLALREVKNKKGLTPIEIGTKTRHFMSSYEPSPIADFLRNLDSRIERPLSSYPSIHDLCHLPVSFNLVKLQMFNNHFRGDEIDVYLKLRDLADDALLKFGALLGLTEAQLEKINCKKSSQPEKEVFLAAKLNNLDFQYQHIVEGLFKIGSWDVARDVCLEQEPGETALSIAAYYGWLDFMKFLVEEKKDDPRTSVNKAGDSTLAVACANGQLELVMYLTEQQGCDPKVSVNKADDTALAIACIKGHLDIVKYLTEKQGCDPKGPVNKAGDTALSLAFSHGQLEVVKYLITFHHCDAKDFLLDACKQNNKETAEFLLHECHCDPNVVDSRNRTLLSLTKDPDIIRLLLKHGAKASNVYKAHSKEIGKLSSERPPDNPLCVLITGDGGSGKSTTLKAVTSEKPGRSLFRAKSKPVSGVDEKTVGIIPYVVESKSLGKIIFYDFAGQRVFCASHSAVLHNAISTAPPVVVFCVDLQGSDKKIAESTSYWMSLVQNQCSNLTDKAHVIVVGSHADKLKEKGENPRAKEGIFSPIIEQFPQFQFVAFLPMDCRFSDSDEMKELRSYLQKSSAILRSPETISLNAHTFYIYLLDSFTNHLAVSLKDVQEKIHSDLDQAESEKTQNLLSFIPSTLPRLVEICEQLSNKGHILFLPDGSSLEKSFVVIDRPTLLSNVTGTVFAPKGFRQHCDLATSTGVVPLTKFAKQFKGYDIDMLIAFMTHLELCFEIKDKEVLECIAKLLADDGEAGSCSDSRYLFFPGLIRIKTPERVWEPLQNVNYHFGWIHQCSQDIQFIDPRCLQVIILRLVFSFGLAPARRIQLHVPSLQRFCSVWKSGIHWCNEDGVTAHLELSDHGKSLVFKIRAEEVTLECLELRRRVITKVVQTVREVCPTVAMVESVIQPKEVVSHPLKSSERLWLFNIHDIATAVARSKKKVKSLKDPSSTQDLLKFEPYAGLDQTTIQFIHSRSNSARDQKITTTFISHFAKQVKSASSAALYVKILAHSQTLTSPSSLDLVGSLKKWRHETEGTYRCLKKTLDKFSIFTGRNLLDLAGVAHSDCDASVFADRPIKVTDHLNVDEHLKEVRDAVWELRAKWNDLAIELDIDEGTRKAIEKTHHHVADDCFTAVLEHWLKCTSPPPTWSVLIEAIKSAAIGRIDLANDMEAKLAHPVKQ